MIDATGSGWTTAKSSISIIHSLHTASWRVEEVRADWRLLGSTPDSTRPPSQASMTWRSRELARAPCSFLDDELSISVPALVASVGVFPLSSGVKLWWLFSYPSNWSSPATRLPRPQATCLDQLPHPGHC